MRGSSARLPWIARVGIAWVLSLGLRPRLEAEGRSADDLRSLVLASKAVVLAKEVASRPAVNDPRPLKTFEIKKVYKGPLLPGMEVEALDGYPRSSDLPGESGLTFDPEVILFLEDWNPSQPKDPGTYAIVDSGLRLLRDRKVYAFGEISFGGGIYPLALTKPRPPEPDESTRIDPGEPVRLEDFEGQIAEALLAVGAVQAALAKPNRNVARDTVLDIVAKVYASDAAWRRKDQEEPFQRLEPQDLLLATIVGRFKEIGDVVAILEAMVRTELYDHRIDSPLLLTEATRKTCPSRLRIAAIRALNIRFTRDTETLSAVVALIGDDDPQVRKAARDRVQYAYSGYMLDRGTPELNAFWTKAMARMQELEAKFK